MNLARPDDARIAGPDSAAFELSSRYTAESGRVQLTGLQALVRLILDRRRLDLYRGRNTGGFVSGYPGSPLAALDKELHSINRLLAELDVVHLPGVNEELAATSVAGSQLISSAPAARVDGVFGVWFGKAPGVDRAGDALKHGNMAGAHAQGGVLAIAGDDPACKSSSLPSGSEVAFYDAWMPVVFPGTGQEVLDIGQHAFALSRASGLWAGMKLVTAVADGFGTVRLDPDRFPDEVPYTVGRHAAYSHRVSGQLLPPYTIEMEQVLHEVRLPLAREYGRLNRLNQVTVDSPSAWLGIAAPGRTYHDLRAALAGLGCDDAWLRRHGVRLLQIRLMYPLDPRDIREFAAGIQEILVVEDKRAFLELFIKDALYGVPDAPIVVGKRDEEDRTLLSCAGSLDSDTLMAAVRLRMSRRIEVPASRDAINVPARRSLPLLPSREPYYCSGCPHSRSTQAAPGTLVGAGIGCHSMVMWMAPERFGDVVGMTQMGGEGAQWLGMAPFTDDAHFVQNLGDGTFFHSGQLAIRAAVAAGAHMTFKLLYNGAMAMTGGQDVAGGKSIASLSRMLLEEGVSRVLVTSDAPRRLRGLPKGVTVWHRDRTAEAQAALATESGVTVLIHDQACAAERRRLRKRGLVPDPPTRVVINPRVCEGCGDCQRKSNCLSLHPQDTEFGTKTVVHQASCNKDLSCLLGDCPSFVTLIPVPQGPREWPKLPVDLTNPLMPTGRDVAIRMPGIGGTGVVTVSQILATAALIDGKHVLGLDQTGLAQKGGPVVSDIRISSAPLNGANRVPAAGADVYLVLDWLVGLSPTNLAVCTPERTVAIINTARTPTGSMLQESVALPDDETITETIGAVTDRRRNVWLDAGAISQALFGDHMPANIIVLGAAFQAGLLPVTAAGIKRAIELNGTGAAKNAAAFQWGRAWVVDASAVTETLSLGATQTPPPPPPWVAGTVDAVCELLPDADTAELRDVLTVRLPDLAEYQNRAHAHRYLAVVRRVAAAEATATAGRCGLTTAVARNLYKLMAYKDEYEVARLHLDPAFGRLIRKEFGAVRRLRRHLHPPALRALGLKRKLPMGVSASALLPLLVRLRGLRGTPFDPFRRSVVRRTERALITEYVAAIDAVLSHLSSHTHEAAVNVAELPDLVRGYEQVKMESVQQFRAKLAHEISLLTT